MSTDTKPRPAFQPSIDTQMLVDVLTKATIGETVTYEKLSEAISQDVRRARGYGFMTSARRITERDHGMVFEAVPNVGLLRLDDVGIVGNVERGVKRVHRATRRGLNRLSRVAYDKLESPDRIRFNTTASHLGVLHEVTSASSRKKIAKAAEKADDKLPMAKTIEAITNGNY